MSFLSTTKPPSGCEAECPECGVTLSRLADMKRHRKTKHSDGTETKFACPLPGCQYKTLQKGNLKTHLVARHSDSPQYPCPECDRFYSDAAARIRHRKRVHGYEPYHTKEYLARQALVEREEVAQGPGRTISTKGRRQRAASAAPYSRPNAPSSGTPLNDPKAVHHDDFWKTLVNIARSYVSNPQYSQEVQLSVPFASTPGRDAPEVIQPFGSLTFGKGHFPKVRGPECQPAVSSTDLDGDGSGSFGPRLDDMLSQGQAFAWSSTQGTNAFSPVPSDFAPLPSPNATSIAPFPTSAEPLTYPEVSLLSDLQNYPMDSYGCNASSSMYAIPDPPMSTPSPSATLQLPFVPTNYGPAQPLESVPEPSWTPTSQQAVSTSFPHLDDFTSEITDFDSWCKLNMVY
ncbi:hypothetical protein BC826DRAFT_982878 [Russula brevipes]|nr:hypothetical protein BC826DRAFT_982878 [Russula brevipes]